jgi:hypothetical protein
VLDADGLPDESMRWQATVVQMDGRRIDLLELTQLARQTGTPAPGSGPRR